MIAIKRILGFLFLITVATAQAETFQIGHITYQTIGGDSVEIIKCSHKQANNLDLSKPIEYNGKNYQLVSIGESAFEDCDNIFKITTPSTLKRIGHKAFYGCKVLYEITLKEGLVSIAPEAFHFCSGLHTISIPGTVKEIGDGAFWRTWSLKDIKVHPSNSEYIDNAGVLFTRTNSRIVAYPAGRNNPTYSLPSNTTCIGTGAFAHCKDLTSIYLPNGLTEIRRYAFEGCKNITTITIPKSVETIEDGVFMDCLKLRTITLPTKMQSIGDHAFDNCQSLGTITVPHGVKRIGDYAFFDCIAMRSINLPKTLENIGDFCFGNCFGMKAIYLTNTKPIKIGDETFPEDLYNNATLYVKYYAVDAFRHTEVWTNFKFIYSEPTSHRPYGLNY